MVYAPVMKAHCHTNNHAAERQIEAKRSPKYPETAHQHPEGLLNVHSVARLIEIVGISARLKTR
jgi:hypothetical protein